MIADIADAPMRTVTLTLDVPADLAERLHALPADTINRFTLAALPAVVEAAEEADDRDDSSKIDFPADVYERYPLPPLLREPLSEALRAGFADLDAGRVTDGETALAELRRYVGRE